jgi:alkanesulfonate monooxygenase SsuD/methylene tetrahydromethanopterin reductase-like flavin-dependent oxidoreductase (luciferase family)
VAEVARLAEEAGVGTLWLAEGEPGVMDPVPWAGSLARGTSTLGVGITVRPSHGRHPSMVARDVTTIDLLTDGRAVVALVEDGETTLDVDRLVEAASVLRRLLTEEHVTAVGSHYEVFELTTRPRPLRPEGPPIVAGVVGPTDHGRRFLESALVGGSADGYVTGGTPDEVTARRVELDALTKDGVGPMLLWRGSLGPDHATAAGLAESVLGAGADGLIAVLGPDSAVEGGLDASAVGRVLEVIGPLAGRLES